MIWGVFADLILIIHTFYILFTVGGELLILVGRVFSWRWIRNRLFRIIHLVCVLFVAFEAVIGIMCPLTVWEHEFRIKAGQHVNKELSFVARIIQNLIFYDFPLYFFIILYVLFAGIVIFTWIFIRPTAKNRK